MKTKALLLLTGAALAAGPAFADGHMASEMTIVSWGGAYSNSQLRAYHEPYMAKNPGVSIINDESAAEAVAKLRAMAEAGNPTWDVVDMVAADALRVCDEGLALELDADTQDSVLRDHEDDGRFELLRVITIFGFFAMEKHGGNKGHASWELIGFKGHQGAWAPPFGYYDAQHVEENSNDE